MADGLLLTRRERIGDFSLKLVCGLAPSLVLIVAAFLLGGGAVGWTVAAFGLLFGFVVAISAKKPRGALMGGVAVALFLLLFQIVVAWFITHPIQRD
ncbi:MAG: hypothetical protein ACYDCH_01860 [Gaiellaceae bacterium]